MERPRRRCGKTQTYSAGFPCEGCKKILANKHEALKAHAWSKVQCRRFIPDHMRLEIESEEADVAPGTSKPQCPGCGRSLGNLSDALKAHAWIKGQCRGAIPLVMRREIESEEGDVVIDPGKQRATGADSQ